MALQYEKDGRSEENAEYLLREGSCGRGPCGTFWSRIDRLLLFTALVPGPGIPFVW